MIGRPKETFWANRKILCLECNSGHRVGIVIKVEQGRVFAQQLSCWLGCLHPASESVDWTLIFSSWPQPPGR